MTILETAQRGVEDAVVVLRGKCNRYSCQVGDSKGDGVWRPRQRRSMRRGNVGQPHDDRTCEKARDLRQREGLTWPVLAERFNVSVTTIRTAVSRLEAVEAAQVAQAGAAVS